MYSKKLLSDIQKYFHRSPKLVLALSGGPDSVFLGTILCDTLPKENIIVVHFNHKLRDDSSNDEEFCRQWANMNGLVFVSEKWKHPTPSEEKARNARYAFLEGVLHEKNADAIILGTHGDDVAETIFFQFLRGSGLSGLSGIPKFNESTKRFRPLVPYSKTEIIKYLQEKSIPFCVDSTNLELGFSRNFLRNEIFPKLQERFFGFEKRLQRQAEIFERVDDFLQELTQEFLQEHSEKISRAIFLKKHPALQAEILKKLFAPKNLDFDQVESLRNFIAIAQSGKKMQIGNAVILNYSEHFFVEKIERK